jgi:hypothetical protein
MERKEIFLLFSFKHRNGLFLSLKQALDFIIEQYSQMKNDKVFDFAFGGQQLGFKI